MRVLGVIPARYGSTRLPGKPLLDLAGKPMIQWVYERARQARLLERLLVATDDERIVAAVEKFGGEARMTSPDHPTGSDRIAEVVRDIECEAVVNVQGDEPLIDPQVIDLATQALLDDTSVSMSTLMICIGEEEARDRNVTKVVVDGNGFALYFSAAPIPCHRAETGHGWRKHIGLYVYRRDFLLLYPTLPRTPLEQTEKLEQLRALEHGYRIKVVETDYDSVSSDVPEDVPRVLALLGNS
mgnify:FL=1